MKLSLKSFKLGDKIYYRFPNPAADVRNYMIGTVRRKGRNYIELADSNQSEMRIDNSHLEYIEAAERTIEYTFVDEEIYQF